MPVGRLQGSQRSSRLIDDALWHVGEFADFESVRFTIDAGPQAVIVLNCVFGRGENVCAEEAHAKNLVIR